MVNIWRLGLKLGTTGFARVVSPKEAGLRVQDWDMWLKIFCVGRCWISLRELATSGLALPLLLRQVTASRLKEPPWTQQSSRSNIQ